MTLIKSLLLGSAAGLVAVTAAQAADLPTRKGPVAAEYVRVCSITVAGAPVVGFVLPGSDTCIKISGYITGQIEGGNLKVGRSIVYTAPGTAQVTTGSFARPSFGYTTRYNLTVDAVSNTAYGPLVAHGEYQFNHGEGFDNTGRGGSDGGLNRAYVTWAGLTAGKIDSFFSFTGGGLGWANFFSPDRKGFAQPDVLAYTASFGGGFSATIAIESPEDLASISGPLGNNLGSASTLSVTGMRVPNIVGALDVHQAWGAAHIGGIAHYVRAASLLAGDNATLEKWGYGIDAGVSFNIPSMAGSMIGVTGAWSKNDIVASGLPDGMWGEGGCVNGNGQCMALADTFRNGIGQGWATPTAWSVTGWAQFAAGPQVTLGIEGSYGEVKWSDTPAITMLSKSKSFIIGGVAHYTPVKNLDFEFELLYQGTTTDRPTGVVGPWQSKADGFASRFEVTRSF